MAHREVGMSEVREILRRRLAGDGLRAIAPAMGVDRKTIAEYIRVAMETGVQRGGPPPSEAQIAAIVGRPAGRTARRRQRNRAPRAGRSGRTAT